MIEACAGRVMGAGVRASVNTAERSLNAFHVGVGQADMVGANGIPGHQQNIGSANCCGCSPWHPSGWKKHQAFALPIFGDPRRAVVYRLGDVLCGVLHFAFSSSMKRYDSAEVPE